MKLGREEGREELGGVVGRGKDMTKICKKIKIGKNNNKN